MSIAEFDRILKKVGNTRGETVEAEQIREEMYAKSCRAYGTRLKDQKRQDRLEARSRGR